MKIYSGSVGAHLRSSSKVLGRIALFLDIIASLIRHGPAKSLNISPFTKSNLPLPYYTPLHKQATDLTIDPTPLAYFRGVSKGESLITVGRRNQTKGKIKELPLLPSMVMYILHFNVCSPFD